MSKLTQGHINCLVVWAKKNPGTSMNVSGLWRNNGFEVLAGHQTPAKVKALKILEEQGYEIDKLRGCVIGNKRLDEHIDPRMKSADKIMEELAEVIEPPKKPKMDKPVVPPEKVKALSQPYLKPIVTPKLLFSYTDVTQDNITMVTDSIRGAVNIGSKKARIKVSVEFCEGE